MNWWDELENNLNAGEWVNTDNLVRECGIVISDEDDAAEDETWIDFPPKPEVIDLCVFHAPCPDGTAAAYAVGKAFPQARFFGVNRGDCNTDSWLPCGVEGKHVVLVDYVYPRALMEELLEKAARVIVVDHHQSELDFLEELSSKFATEKFVYIYSDTFCAAVLAWKWLMPPDNPLPLVFKYICDNDTGTWDLSHSSDFRRGLDAISPIVDCGECDFNRDFCRFDEGVIYGRRFVMSRVVMGVIAWYVKEQLVGGDAQRFANRRLKVAPELVCRVLNTSNTSHSDLRKRWEADEFDLSLVYYYVDRLGYWKCSLRSNDRERINVETIAKCFGGGGHAGAASFHYRGPSMEDLFLPRVLTVTDAHE
ncbi:hypothetical protein C9890_0511 [Perkinsus sp. BL_2016]|nr:hypothetical protein C9890_0511 [Perkinsus sp. BL_2016]